MELALTLIFLLVFIAVVTARFAFKKYQPPSNDWQESSCEKARKDEE